MRLFFKYLVELLKEAIPLTLFSVGVITFLSSYFIPSLEGLPGIGWLCIGIGFMLGNFRLYKRYTPKLIPNSLNLEVNAIVVTHRQEEPNTGVTHIHNVWLDIMNPKGQTNTVTGIEVTIEEGTFEGKNLSRMKLKFEDDFGTHPTSLNPGDKKYVGLFYLCEKEDKKEFGFSYRSNNLSESWNQVKAGESHVMIVRISATDTPDQEWKINFGIRGNNLYSKAIRTRPVSDTTSFPLQATSPLYL